MTEESVQIIKAIHLMEAMKMISPDERKEIVRKLYDNISDLDAEKIEKRWMKIREELNVLIKTA